MVKQVIVVRRDLKMRRGKEIAQGSHASCSWMAKLLWAYWTENKTLTLTTPQEHWLREKFTKVCLQVESEAELLEIYEKAKAAGLDVHLITDAGKTEFHGVPTNTCLAIGPDWEEKIDPITGHLKLY